MAPAGAGAMASMQGGRGAPDGGYWGQPKDRVQPGQWLQPPWS
jgi:hypothetical protein